MGDHEVEDLEEERHRWEGIHDDEAAQYRLPFENTGAREWAACCILPGLGVAAVFMAAAYSIFKLMIILL